MYLPAYGGNPEILEKIDFSMISRFREASDIQPLLRACLFEAVKNQSYIKLEPTQYGIYINRHRGAYSYLWGKEIAEPSFKSYCYS